MNKKRLFYIGILTILIIALYSFFKFNDDKNVLLTKRIIKSSFINEVIISGEAQAISSKNINGPTTVAKYGIYQITILDLIPEGTMVKKGDYIGRLDASEVNSKINDARLNLEKAESRYIQQQLDTTLTLRQERNSIKDLIFNLEEKKLELKRSIYEPPSTIRQLENEIEKNNRDLKEKREDYSIKKRQANAKMFEASTEVSKIKKQIEDLIDLQEEFTIYSTDNGLLTYFKERSGGKKKIGSAFTPWDPVIVSLPDLSKMESLTYINEVDIRKIKKGLKTKISFDAFPDIEIDGVVNHVANAGETKRGSDIKLFQVLITLNETNENIKPGMTTSNRIITHQIDNVLIAPLEAIFIKDTISYVYVKSGYSIEKKQVKLGLANNNDVIIEKGLKENDVVYLNEPEKMENKNIMLLK